MASTTTSLKLDADLKRRIQRLAESRKRTPHWLMKEAIEKYAAHEEWRDELWRDANAAMEDYDRTGLHLTGEEVQEWLRRRAAGEDVDLPPCHT
jgi:predicted transcriptional regulator